MKDIAIKIDNVSKKFGSLEAVCGLELEIRSGVIFGLLGPNGAGKTTTIKLITGLLKPDQGSIVISGYDIQKQPEGAKKTFSLIPDVPYLYGKLTGWEFMKFILKIYGIQEKIKDDEIIAQLKLFNIYHAAHDLTESYSHGMRQRLLISSALIREPEILILDEPMVGLDPEAARMVKDIFLELVKRGRTIFLSTHTLTDAQELCDEIAVISSGKLIAKGSYEELRSSVQPGAGSLEELYLKITRGEVKGEQ